MVEKNKIYMDYQATTPIDEQVYQAMGPYLKGTFGNPHSNDHWFGWEAHKAVEAARKQVAKLINAGENEIIFTSGATEANNLAIQGVAKKLNEAKQKILISAIEHKCVIEAAKSTHELGFETVIVPVDSNGFVDLKRLSNVIDDQVALVSVIAVNNEIGTIQPLKEIGMLCREKGALLHTDAAQALPCIDIDVRSLGIDLLSISGHKIYGPKGIGALYISENVKNKISPLIYGGGQELGYRSGTLPTFLCVGLGEAANLISNFRNDDHKLLKRLSAHFLYNLRNEIPNIALNGPETNRHPGNVNVQFPGIDAHDLLMQLQPLIAASTGSACSSGSIEASHVLYAIGLNSAEASSSIRFSFGRYTTLEEIDRAIELVSITYKNIIELENSAIA